MGGSPRSRIWVPALAWVVVAGSSAFGQGPATDGKKAEATVKPDKPTPAPAAEADKAKLKPEDYALPGEDPPHAFVPKTPITASERKEIDALRLYALARSQEERRQFRDAIKTLEEALAADPDSVAVLRRLSRLTGAMGQVERSIEYSQRVIKADPDDAATIARLVEFYKGRRRDASKAEAMLKEVVANPKLDKKSAAYILSEHELAKIYSETNRFNEAAASLEKVMGALDDKSTLKLTPADQRRILGLEESDAYARFGLIFLAAKKYEQAITAFRRGLVYDPEHTVIPIFLAQALSDQGKADEALKLIEGLLKKNPSGRDVYELLAQILTKLNRAKEIIPRLEAAAKADGRNVELQHLLVDRYRAAGLVKEADALMNKLVDVQPDLRGFSKLFDELLKQKKSEELLQLLEKVSVRLRREDAIRAQVETIAADPAGAERLIDAGLKMLSAEPPKLDRAGWLILVRIATAANKPEKLVELLRASLKRSPDPLVYRELAIQLAQIGRNEEAEKVVLEWFDKFPQEKNSATLVLLARLRLRANKTDAALETLAEAGKVDPRSTEVPRTAAFVLAQQGKTDEAVATLKGALKVHPTDPDMNATLAGILSGAGRNDAAIAHWKDVLEKHPNDAELAKVGHSSLSTIYTNMGDFVKGEAELELLYAKDADDVGVNNDLGYLYADQGKNLEKAEAMIRKAVVAQPENSSYLDSMGWVLYRRGKFKEAAVYLEKAVRFLDTDDATIHDHLGDVYYELKERDKAKESWKKAEKIASSARPPDKKLDSIRKKLSGLDQLKPTPDVGGPKP